MECRKCQANLTTDDVNLDVAGHDDSLFDIIITCEECGAKYNNFISFDEFVDMEES